MYRRLTLAVASLAWLAPAGPGQKFDASRTALPERSAAVVDYKMNVRLDPVNKLVTGSQEIRYRNKTKGATPELRFHFYLNAFRNLRSTHLRESDEAARKRYKSEEEFGSVAFTKLQLVSGAGGPKDLLGALEWVADDGNSDDRTVARVVLPAVFRPGEELVLDTRFESKLPKAYRRTGWGPGDFFMVAQWFPKLGVLEDAGGGRSEWNCHQFHAWSEFHADFGSYDVTIATPAGWPVGATGKQVGETQKNGDAEVRRFVQADVHDFAWVTDPDYRVHTFEWKGADQLEPAMRQRLLGAGWKDSDLALSDVRVRMLLHPEHDTAVQVARHRNAVAVALRFFGSRFGRYPYETLTVVDPCTDLGWRRLGGGMEYPTLITCGTRLFPHPRQMRPEGVTVHEFGHQFWYLLSANNEFEESWLDEGICSYTEGRAQDLAYAGLAPPAPAYDPVYVTEIGPFGMRGKALGEMAGAGRGIWSDLTLLDRVPLELLAGVPGVRATLERKLAFRGTLLPDLPIVEYMRTLPFLTYEKDIPYRNLYNDRQRYLLAPSKDPVVRRSWEYVDRESYRTNSYPRPATILCTLERMMGADKWWPCMRRFHERARFAHPTTKDFLDTVREFGGEEVASFAREALYTNKVLDYGIASVRAVQPPKRFGNFDEGEADRGSQGEVVVTVRRYGELMAALPVRFEFEKAGIIDTVWPLAEQRELPWRRFRFEQSEIEATGKLLRVWVDPPDANREVGQGPCGKLVLDANLLNNSWQHEPDRRPARRHGLRLWTWLQTVMGFFGGIG